MNFRSIMILGNGVRTKPIGAAARVITLKRVTQLKVIALDEMSPP